MKQKHQIADIRKAAQIVLCAAVKETFPQALLAGGGTTPLGFYSDFIFPFEFQKSFLPLLEEGMSRIAKKDIDFDVKEMVPVSAEAMLLHKGELLRSGDVKECMDSLVSLVHILSFVDYLEGDLVCPSTSYACAFKLKHFDKVGKRSGKEVIRIFGAADFDKQSLKTFLKEESEIVQKTHMHLGRALELFSLYNEEGSLYLWHPKGVECFGALNSFERGQLDLGGYRRVQAPNPDAIAFYEDIEEEGMSSLGLSKRSLLFKPLKERKIYETVSFWDRDRQDFSSGLLQAPQSHFDIAYCFCGEKQLFEQCISSLQFISKMHKILGFEFKIIFSVRKAKPSSFTSDEKKCAEALKKAAQSISDMPLMQITHSTFKGAKVEFKVADALGRDWSTGFLQVFFGDNTPKEASVIFSLLGSKERMIALLLERHGAVPPVLAQAK